MLLVVVNYKKKKYESHSCLQIGTLWGKSEKSGCILIYAVIFQIAKKYYF